MDQDTRPRRVIAGETYVLDLWTTSDAFEWQARLADLGLEAFAMALSERNQLWAQLDEADFAVIARHIADKLKGANLSTTMVELLGGVWRIEKRAKGDVPVQLSDDYETRFRGNLTRVYELAGWVIAENFKDFTIAGAWCLRGLLLLSALRQTVGAASAIGEMTEPQEEAPAEASEAPSTAT